MDITFLSGFRGILLTTKTESFFWSETFILTGFWAFSTLAEHTTLFISLFFSYIFLVSDTPEPSFLKGMVSFIFLGTSEILFSLSVSQFFIFSFR